MSGGHCGDHHASGLLHQEPGGLSGQQTLFSGSHDPCEPIPPVSTGSRDLVAHLQADQRVLKDFLSEKLPRISSHFASHSVDVSLITFNWFLVVFVESLPSDILLLLWDAFLYEGTKVNRHAHTGSEGSLSSLFTALVSISGPWAKIGPQCNYIWLTKP